MENKSEKLKDQIIEAAGNVQYTFIAHWNIVNRLKEYYWYIKIAQIVLTAVAAGGFLTSLVSGIPQLSWVGGLTSAIALGINLYMLNFNLPDNIKQHIDAANALWEVRERYKSLIVDFDDIDILEARNRRDKLIQIVSEINKKYPGTDEKSFKRAQADIGKYEFNDGEAEVVLNIKRNKS
ncbi:SLATT domain-containing protein [Selenomonas sp. ND2010]|uniref:SLATT domain-containing protein n=1 Tax=Selenomonas sp. ND2010 TaxID=1410618 RepID=UPI00051C769C|nr:SLATT domain-containing protein [Selenomonas sp. ND2010]